MAKTNWRGIALRRPINKPAGMGATSSPAPSRSEWLDRDRTWDDLANSLSRNFEQLLSIVREKSGRPGANPCKISEQHANRCLSKTLTLLKQIKLRHPEHFIRSLDTIEGGIRYIVHSRFVFDACNAGTSEFVRALQTICTAPEEIASLNRIESAFSMYPERLLPFWLGSKAKISHT